MISAGILTISDKGARGERNDTSSAAIRELLGTIGAETAEYAIVPDEPAGISGKLAEWADSGKLELVITTGGTGLGARDNTPEATRAIIDKEVPGLAEIMRMRTFKLTPAAVISRGVAGVRGKCLIINLPGNEKAVRQCLGVILPAIPHAVEMVTGAVTEHASE